MLKFTKQLSESIPTVHPAMCKRIHSGNLVFTCVTYNCVFPITETGHGKLQVKNVNVLNFINNSGGPSYAK
jgi:hypothetical protein